MVGESSRLVVRATSICLDRQGGRVGCFLYWLRRGDEAGQGGKGGWCSGKLENAKNNDNTNNEMVRTGTRYQT